jgi:NAD-dependent SIR2 family protein deacetylase
MECHGSIHYLQCIQNCQKEIWQDIELKIKINDENFKALDPLPICPHCHSLARPNILMFGDFWFEPKRVSGQSQRFESWLDKISSKQLSLAIIEIGAGTAVPTVRNLSENLSKRFQTPLIRINPRESFGANIAIELGAKEALEKIINL